MNLLFRGGVAVAVISWVDWTIAAQLEDVTFPGDPVISTSSNGIEVRGPYSAIDNESSTTYLNFDRLNTGLTVIPRLGLTLVRGLTLTAAGEHADRDPTSYTLEGSLDGEDFTLISSGLLPAFTRFSKHTIEFENDLPYLQYRLIFPTINGSACCMEIAEIELMGERGPRDVTMPGDSINAAVANSQGSDTVANAIDDQPSKYIANPGSAGLIVTPSAGVTVVTGLALTSAEDPPDRDPTSYALEGSNDGTNFISISRGMVPPFPRRFSRNLIFFPGNANTYLEYRLTFPTANGSACCVVISEVELLGRGPGLEACLRTDGQLIREQPVDAFVPLGSRATFQVVLMDPGRVQWYRNGQPIPGAIGETYVTPPITADDDGARFHADVEGPSCERTDEVTLHLDPPPVSNLRLEINGSNGSIVISWPIELAGYVLQRTSSLTPPSWTLVPNVASNRVTLVNPVRTSFFRLAKP